MARAKRPAGNGIRLAGIRRELRSAEAARAGKRDPRLGGDWAPELSSVERETANDASPVTRQARRNVEAIDAGAGIITACPSWHRWPVLEHVPGVKDRAVKRVYVDAFDAVRPIHTPRQPEALAAELAEIRAELGLPADAETIWI